MVQRLFEMPGQNQDYAEATGVSRFFVRTLHMVGTQLLEKHKLCPTDMARFGRMIERTLVWEPANSDCRMLWAGWFEA